MTPIFGERPISRRCAQADLLPLEPAWRIRLGRWAALACVGAFAITAVHAGGTRPAVITQRKEVADLWWCGELTDQAGNRWDIAILPGMKPSFQISGDSFQRSGQRFTEYANAKYWAGVGRMSKGCFASAGADCIRDFVVTGIGEDYRDTNGTLGRLASERPFGWIAQITWRTFWGYAIKPVSRSVLGPVGAVASVGGGVLVPIGGVLYPPVIGAADVAVVGVAVPVARIVWQQPAWMFSLLNNEPAESSDGSWGLSIIARPPGWKSPQALPVEPPPVPVDAASLSRLAQALIGLEERLVRSGQQEHAQLLRVNGFQRSDGSPAALQVEPSALVWLATVAPDELESWRNQARTRLGAAGDQLPSTNELLQQLRLALQLEKSASAVTAAPVSLPAVKP